MDLKDLTIKKIHEGFKKKEFSSTEITKAYLDHTEAIDNKIDAFLSISRNQAMAQAEEADKVIATQKDFSPLMGVPVAIKDNMMIEGQPATAASKILENYIAPYDATVITKLKREGAVMIGKTNLDEFAMGASTENSAFKTTKNPHDLTRVAGGSSGGSAAAVAAHQAAYSLGSDTGGSIRLPASFCGVVGLKPTYGTVSRHGLIALASSLDQIGPFAKTIEDTALVFGAISGKDAMDATSVEYAFKSEEIEVKGLKIGIPKEYFAKGLDPQVEAIIKNAIKKAEEQGAKIIEVSLPSLQYAVACYYITLASEASANLARFDGIRYGFSQPAEKLLDVYLKSRGVGFGPEPKRRIMLGTYSLSSGYYDAYYKKAQQVRELIGQDFANAFKKVDVIFSPVAPSPAFKIGEKASDPLSMYLVDIYTVSVNLAGVPAVSMPAGMVDKLPVGLQIIGNHFEEAKILGVANQIEKMLQL